MTERKKQQQLVPTAFMAWQCRKVLQLCCCPKRITLVCDSFTRTTPWWLSINCFPLSPDRLPLDQGMDISKWNHCGLLIFRTIPLSLCNVAYRTKADNVTVSFLSPLLYAWKHYNQGFLSAYTFRSHTTVLCVIFEWFIDCKVFLKAPYQLECL